MRDTGSRRTLARLIVEEYPRRPACFESDRIWREWLLSAYQAGDRVARRVDVGKSRGERETWYALLPTQQIDYCVDCTLRRQQQMLAQGRCERADDYLSEEVMELMRAVFEPQSVDG